MSTMLNMHTIYKNRGKHLRLFADYLKPVLLILMISCFFGNSTSAQVGCKTGCTSNDVQIKRAYLLKNLNGDPLEQCESGTTVEAFLFIELTTNTPRIGVSISGRIVSDDGAETQLDAVGQCFSDRLASNGITIVKFTTPVKWTCGTAIKLKDVLIGWGTGNTNFCTGTAPQCPATSSKCWRQGETTYIPIVTFPCTAPSITTQPGNQEKCEGQNAQFSIAFTEGNPSPASIQWQVSTNGGSTWSNITNVSPYSGATTSTLSITGVLSTMDGYKYKAVLTNNTTTHNCGATSLSGTLTVNQRPGNPTVSVSPPTCTNSNGSVTVTAPLDDAGNNIDYEYKLGNGNWGDNTTFTVAAEAPYTIHVRNKVSLCEANGTATGTMGAQPAAAGTLTVQVTQPTCTSPNGRVTVTAPIDDAGNSIDYHYSNNGGTYQESPEFTVAANTAYSIVAQRKGSGCTSNVVTGTMGAQPVAAGTLTIQLTQPTCASSNGKVTVTAPLDGNNIDYEYSNNGGNYQEDPEFTVAANAAYNIVARRKGSGCISNAVEGTMGAQPSGPPAPAIEIISDVSCSSSSGTIKIVIASSKEEYDTEVYEFSNGGTFWGNNPVFTFKAGEGYDLWVRRKSDNTCVASVTCAGEAKGDGLGSAQISTNKQTYDVAIKLDPKSKLMASPNPFSERIRFTINSSVSGRGTLELYNLSGQKVKTVFEGQVQQGQVQTVEYMVPASQRSSLVYVFTVGTERTSGKLINLKQ